MVIDTCPLADSLWNGDIVLLSHYSNEICELEIGTYPFDSGIRFFACKVSTDADQTKTASSESGLSTSATSAQPTPAQQQQGGGWSFWIMMIAIFVIFYFFMIRPQQKKQKELQKQRDALKKGDRVISAGGIYGIIKEVNETTFLIEVAKDVVIKMDKGSIYVAADDVHQAQEVADKK